MSAPVTEKETGEGYTEELAFGLAAMQGWRVSMEDAHISELELDLNSKTALFSIFDGHGGKAVAKFSARHLPEELLHSAAYKRGDLRTAMTDAYFRLDQMLDSEPGKLELEELVGEKNRPTSLFTDVEQSLGTSETPAGGALAQRGSRPDRKHGLLQKVDSSKDFLASHLMRVSVINPVEGEHGGGAEDASNGAAGQPAGKQAPGAEEEDEDEAGHRAGGMGCTAVSLLYRDGEVVVANTGDSRCVLSRKGQAVALTLDHKPILFEEARRIIKAGGFVRDNRVNGALNVSRTIGDLDFKRNAGLPQTEQMVVATPDVEVVKLREGDEFAILACDGIWDVLSNQEAVDYARKRLKQGMAVKDICEQMCDACLAPDLKGLCRGADNMSVIIVLFKKYGRVDSFWSRLWGRFR